MVQGRKTLIRRVVLMYGLSVHVNMWQQYRIRQAKIKLLEKYIRNVLYCKTNTVIY